MPVLRFLRTGPDAPPLEPAIAVRLLRRYRWSTFLGITIGYAFFYTTRLSLAVAKKPMIDAGLVTAEDLGSIGSALYLTYAFGRLTHGFLCDHAHIGRFMAVGLGVSALLNIAFGSAPAAAFFLPLWALNGWFQSMGSAPSAANLVHWFPRAERGRRYSVWSLAHNLGEGVTFAGTAVLVAALGWRWGFWAPGTACLAVAVALAFFVKDRPAVYGLPGVAAEKPASIGRQQLRLLRLPAIWILGLASASLYMVRYGVNEWFILFLQETKGYDLVAAGVVTSASPIAGALGTVAAGFLSDVLFGGRRLPVSLAYSALLIASLVALPLIPAGMPWADAAAASAIGFAVGGLLVFLAGLMAVDLAPAGAAGAAMGIVGVFSYLGASAQNWLSGVLLERSLGENGGAYDFGPVLALWLCAAVVSLALSLVLVAMRGVRARV